MRERGESFYDFAYRTSVGYRDYFRDLAPLATGRHAEFAAEAEQSWEAHERLEASEQGSFRDYLAHYFAD
jgi:glutamate--cysteine ligase